MRPFHPRWLSAFGLGASLALATSLQAQTTRPAQATRPADAAATRPAMDARQARVEKVAGSVSYSVLGEDGNYGPWQPVKAGDLLPPGARIQTRLRSHVVLTFGDDTVVMIDRATLASIDQFRQSQDTKEIRLGLGHGAVRAGVASTTLRSDMTIATPTATLSKRGTHDFGMEYEPSTGRFRVFLTQQGLVEVLNRVTNARQSIAPGQYVNQAMVRWIETAKFDRWVPIQDFFGLTANERGFAANRTNGMGVSEPGGGAYAMNGSVPQGSSNVAGTVGGRLATAPPVLPVTPPQPQGPPVIGRPEGNFGARR